MTNKYCSIQLRGIELNLHLGWPDAERASKQKIHVDLMLRFATPPKACDTDDLTDTYCYDTLIRLLANQIEAKEYRLIESLAQDIYNIIRKNTAGLSGVNVSILKKPAIDKLTGGVVVSYGDDE